MHLVYGKSCILRQTRIAVNFDDFGIVVIGRNEGQRLVDCLMSLNLLARPIHGSAAELREVQ